MERDSFIFYKSFYEAIIDLPKDIRLEVLTAIIEYGLYGREPGELKPFARGMFRLVRPIIDVNNTRFENGKKGGRKKKQPTPDTPYSLSYKDEIEILRKDKEIAKTICDDFRISPEEYQARLPRFLTHCLDEGKKKERNGHTSLNDATKHLRYWMTKAFPEGASPAASKTKTGTSKTKTPKTPPDNAEKGTPETPDQLIRRLGYDPGQVSLAQVLNPDWRDKNPPNL